MEIERTRQLNSWKAPSGGIFAGFESAISAEEPARVRQLMEMLDAWQGHVGAQLPVRKTRSQYEKNEG